jgi:hypothetical protein
MTERIEGPFSQSKLPVRRREMLVGSLIWNSHKGRARAISIAHIHEIFSEFDERAIKAAVAELVLAHRCRIGSFRGENPGYFWIVDAEDERVGTAHLRAQLVAEHRRLRTLLSDHTYNELVGQLRLGDDEEKLCG